MEAVPALVSVMVCAAVVTPVVPSVKEREPGARVATAAAVPESATVCGDPAALSETFKFAL